MSLSPDVQIDRRRLKRQLGTWRLLAVVLALVAAGAGISRFTDLFRGDHVVRYTVNGFILQDVERDRALAAVAEDDAARALVVHINSPGGSVVGGEDLYRALRGVSENKPVAVVMGTLATSAGYMTAIAGDRIFARESSVTGSIGVLFQTTEVTELMDKLGVRSEAIKSSPLKAQPSPFEPLTDAGRAATRDLVEDMFDFFVDLVAERRPMSRAETLQLADGRVYTGRQALANKLIDEIGDETAARRWLAAAHEIDVTLPIEELEVQRSDPFFAGIASSLVEKSVISKALRLDGLVSLWHPELR